MRMKGLIIMLLAIATIHAQFSIFDSFKFFQQSLPLIRDATKLTAQLAGEDLIKLIGNYILV